MYKSLIRFEGHTPFAVYTENPLGETTFPIKAEVGEFHTLSDLRRIVGERRYPGVIFCLAFNEHTAETLLDRITNWSRTAIRLFIEAHFEEIISESEGQCTNS